MTEEQMRQRAHQHYTEYASGDGAKVAFFIVKEPIWVAVFVAGLRKSEAAAGGAADYTLSGNKVTFAVAPAAGTRNVVFDIVSR